MDANPENLITEIRTLRENPTLTWRQRATLAWVVGILMTMSGCASSDPWTRQDTVLQSIYTATLVVDAVQTSDIQYRDDLVEGGYIASRVLGPNPSTSDTWQYFATVGISHYLISRALPARWRPYWQGSGIFIHGRAVMSNCALGLGSICEED